MAVVAPVVASAVGKYLVQAVISAVVSALIAKMIGGKSKSRSSASNTQEDAGQLQTILAGSAWIPHVYGTARVGAVVTDQFVTDAQGGNVVDTGSHAYAVYAISVGEINRVKNIYYYDIPIFASDYPAFNTVHSGSAISAKLRNQVRCEIKSGASGQSVSSLLSAITGQTPGDTANSRYESSDIGSGIAYFVLEIKRDREDGVIGEATPTSITLDIEGRKVRDITQSGSPLTFTDNPALIALEELRDTNFGAGIPDENIDFYSFADWKANNDTEGFGMRGRFPQGATTAEILNLCEIHSDADVIDQNGIITAIPDEQVVSGNSVKITDDNVINGLTRTEVSTSNIFTSARVSYMTDEGIETLVIREFDEATIDSYGYRPTDIDLKMSASKTQAEKLGARALIQQTLPTITGTLTKEGYEISVGDVVETDFTIGDILPAGSKIKITGVTKKRVSNTEPVTFTGRLYDDEVFTQQLNTKQVPASVFSNAPGLNDVPAPNVTNSPSVADDNRITVTVDNIFPQYAIEWQFKKNPSSSFEALTGPTGSTSTMLLTLPALEFTNATVRLRYVNNQGITGAYTEITSLNNTGKTPVFINSSNQLIRVDNTGTGIVAPVGLDSDAVSNIASSVIVIDSDFAPAFYLLDTDSDAYGLSADDVSDLFRNQFGDKNFVNGMVVQVQNDSDTRVGFYQFDSTAGKWIETSAFVDGNLVVTGTISTDKLSANAVTADKIAANTITASEIASGTITATEIASATITASEIAAGTITANEIAAGVLDVSRITSNGYDSDRFDDSEGSFVIDNTMFRVNVGGLKIDTESGEAVIDGQSATISNLNADNITVGNIDANTITLSNLNGSNISSGQINAARLDLDTDDFTVVGNSLALATGGGTVNSHTFSGSAPDASSLNNDPNTYLVMDWSLTQDGGGPFFHVISSPSTSNTATSPGKFMRLTLPSMTGSSASTFSISNLRVWCEFTTGSGGKNLNDALSYSSSSTYKQGEVAKYNNALWYSETTSNQGNTPSDSSSHWNRFSHDELSINVVIKDGSTTLGTVSGPTLAADDIFERSDSGFFTGIINGSTSIGTRSTGDNLDLYLQVGFGDDKGTFVGGDSGTEWFSGCGVYQGASSLTASFTVNHSTSDGTGSATFETGDDSLTSGTYEVTSTS